MAHLHEEPIVNALHDYIQQERKRNFRFLDRHSHAFTQQEDLLVVTRADPEDVYAIRWRCGPEATTTWGDWFTFYEPLRGDGFTRTVAIEILPGDAVTVENMTVIEFGQTTKNTMEAVAWLQDTYCSDANDLWAMRFPETQYDEQRMWWDSTGQTFPILELPPELRLPIYLHIIGPVVVPDVIPGVPKQRLILGIGQSLVDSDHRSSSRLGRVRDPDIQRPNMHILRVNKQINREASEVAVRDTTKRFTWLRGLRTGPLASPHTIFRSILANPPDPSFLRHIQLEMSASQYFDFIGIYKIRDRLLHHPLKDLFFLKALFKFENLTTLDFRFISPKHLRAECPFSGPKTTQAVVPARSHSCQKKWIHFFFALALPVLRKLIAAKKLTVTTSGCIKTSSKIYWEYLINDTKNNHCGEIARMKAKGNISDRELFDCECSYPCAAEIKGAMYEWEEWMFRRIEGLRELKERVYWDFED
ncbi:n amino acid transport system [Pyrenophora seminiperda CCB06]|uniref:N amino acid transport system n=1 Tax=Pyrenophora seminiperda CCB06 TaxID=1302712 RepID=A0A3M7MIU3_9PLEO|nr:n amino acid transport system [Pyrenophora seminiperda CCB06]